MISVLSWGHTSARVLTLGEDWHSASAVRHEEKVFLPLAPDMFLCADRVNEEYQGEKGPKDRRGNRALPDWISLVLWYVFHFSHPKHGLPGLTRRHSSAAREEQGGFGSSLFCSKSEQMVIVFSLFVMVYLHCWKFIACCKALLWPDGSKPQQ